MDALLNIPRKVDDPTYRYKMHALRTFVEGRGNGVRTVILNLQDVAKELHRLPAEITKFIAIELGSMSKSDEVNLKYVVNGQHTTEVIQGILDKYIEKFVLCPKCHLPETELSFKLKAAKINYKCFACGAKELVDMSHRLTTFMLRNRNDIKKQMKSSGNPKASKEAPEVVSSSAASAASPSSSSAAASAASAAAKVTEDPRGELDHYQKVRQSFEKGDMSTISSVVKKIRIAEGYGNRKDRILIVVLSLFGLSPNLADVQEWLANPVFQKYGRKMIKTDEDQQTLLGAAEKYVALFPTKALYTPVILRYFLLNGLLDESLILSWQESKGPSSFSYPGTEEAAIQGAKDQCLLFVHWLK